MTTRTLSILLLLLNALHATAAEPVTTVRRVIGKASSAANTSLPVGASFSTSARSKAELEARRGTVRLGERAAVDVTAGGGLALRQGVTLVASKPGAFRKTIEVRAPGYRARVRGTAQISYDPGRVMKVVVLEGTVSVSLDSLAGEVEQLTPGQQLIINPSDNRLPEPVEVDLGRLVSTSQMVEGEFGKLATASLIDASIADQGSGLRSGDLALTQLLLRGTETELEILDAQRDRREEVRALLLRPPDPVRVEQTIFQSINDLDNPRAVNTTRPYTFPAGSDSTTLGSFTFARDTQNLSRTGSLSVNLNANGYTDDMTGANIPPTLGPSITGTVRADPDTFAGTKKELLINANVQLPDDAGFERLLLTSTADIATPPGVGLTFKTIGIDIEGAVLKAGAVKSASELLKILATSGDIRIVSGSTLSGGAIHVQGGNQAIGFQTIAIDQSRLTARGKLSVGINTTRTGIDIRNSSELASLVANIDLITARAPITVDGSSLKAKTRITLDSLGDLKNVQAANAGTVSIRNAQLMADTIKVRAYTPSGDALIIDGSTFNAGALIRLYAEGVSTLRFRNNVTLNAKQVDLAGPTVEVDAGGNVQFSGKARVFTDQPNYNIPGYGTIQGPSPITRKFYGERPKF